MANKKLEEFVIRLSEDAKLMESYVENPKAVMRGAGLDETDIKTILKGETKEINKLLGSDMECYITGIITLMKK
ncbi:MAG: hypothetical protein HWD86_05365 [Kangiellaceae bacterium]|nr:hypothetical protein [Kangiellaceae bacterium]